MHFRAVCYNVFPKDKSEISKIKFKHGLQTSLVCVCARACMHTCSHTQALVHTHVFQKISLKTYVHVEMTEGDDCELTVDSAPAGELFPPGTCCAC